jgi:hypothetical protein
LRVFKNLLFFTLRTNSSSVRRALRTMCGCVWPSQLAARL